jgi:hypothetical protein
MQSLGAILALAGGFGGLPFNEVHPNVAPDNGAFKSKGRYRKGTDVAGAGKANKLRKRRAKKGYR